MIQAVKIAAPQININDLPEVNTPDLKKAAETLRDLTRSKTNAVRLGIFLNKLFVAMEKAENGIIDIHADSDEFAKAIQYFQQGRAHREILNSDDRSEYELAISNINMFFNGEARTAKEANQVRSSQRLSAISGRQERPSFRDGDDASRLHSGKKIA